MNLLFVGAGKGAWAIRGQQLGAALGARVVNTPSDADWRWADLAVLVKRAGPMFAAQAHRAGVPVVWDALDFWRQPTDNGRDERGARHLLEQALSAIRPVAMIGATKVMAAAAGGTYLPHHSWPHLTTTPARACVQVVAYQGGEVYLGSWRKALEAACRRRGWRFVVNPVDLRDADILVAFRDGQWDGWMCREWKSGVKVVNALAAGKPLITQASAAVREIGHGTVIATVEELDAAFDRWTTEEARALLVAASVDLAKTYTLREVAAHYVDILADTRDRCAA